MTVVIPFINQRQIHGRFALSPSVGACATTAASGPPVSLESGYEGAGIGTWTAAQRPLQPILMTGFTPGPVGENGDLGRYIRVTGGFAPQSGHEPVVAPHPLGLVSWNSRPVIASGVGRSAFA